MNNAMAITARSSLQRHAIDVQEATTGSPVETVAMTEAGV